MTLNTAYIQQILRAHGIDAWALYDFRGSNSIAWTTLNVAPEAHCTRRWMVVIPADGTVVKVVHSMEQHPLHHLDVAAQYYTTHQEWVSAVQQTLAPYKTLAMEYSPNGSLPVVSKVDAGTLEMVRGLGHTIVSSADISQYTTSVLSNVQLAGAAVTAGLLRDAMFEGFSLVRERLLANSTVTEYEVQQHILAELQSRGLETDGELIVAIGTNASSPHYAPTALTHSRIRPDMLLLLDCWARSSAPGSVWADLTWMAYTSDRIPEHNARIFDSVTQARDAAITLVQQRIEAQQIIKGCEVDNAARTSIIQSGFGAEFIHRTGHSITTELHGPGVNMDSYETDDTRQLLPGTTFSIEPGVYIAGKEGYRSEINIIIDHNNRVQIPSAPIQHGLLPLLAEDWQQ
ncbi:MAG: aminopeptidase P family protein [Chlorobi bacterium]|nr:MAG: aminopeptidase P family protein [Bacteroidota bacterium]KXK35323.1 MAG: Xaa-Pro dipeptidase [Chlorobi bacterium OLB6]MBE2265098.1 aminopeptidase P family protein [Flavobacteriales bacterium]MBL1160771.1 aminopeptidase P family protein [Chlorobiota bacterium]MBW7853122.1 aminopeptidase P family protein [Candidatus Kapabacteria bacterium]MCC6331389.1 aminopeptidase P family protein [Ignavibacteria bacterium]